jgi:hypothetical protein
MDQGKLNEPLYHGQEVVHSSGLYAIISREGRYNQENYIFCRCITYDGGWEFYTRAADNRLHAKH